jgi:hypothetical protein
MPRGLEALKLIDEMYNPWTNLILVKFSKF